MFIAELNLYISYFKEQLDDMTGLEQDAKRKKNLHEFYQNMIQGICYYRSITDNIVTNKEQFTVGLNQAERDLDALQLPL